MSHVIAGRVRARCATGVEEPLAEETILLYRVPAGEASHVGLRSHEEARGREYLLHARGRTDADGGMRIDFREPGLLGHRGSRHPYEGGPLAVEIYYRGLGSRKEPVQIALGHVTPTWQESGGVRFAHLDLEIDPELFGRARAALDIWTVCGSVHRSDGLPAVGYRVFAHDSDALHDDFLGSAVVGEEGSFRIDYPGDAFRPRTVAGVDLERGGPELYFRVETPQGRVVYEEPSSRGIQRDRANAPNWFSVELAVEPAADLPLPRVPRP
jgi:hypothetical protein